MSAPHIALMTDGGPRDWHARRLVRAFTARGAVVTPTTLRDCAFDTASPTGLRIPGFADSALPDAVFVRAIAAGSLEQITFRLGILHALEACGVPVWNPARAIERAVDKSTAAFLFQRAGLPVPRTVTVEGEAAAARVLAEVAVPAVSKPLFGAQGVGIRRLDGAADLPAGDDVGHVYHMQRLITGPAMAAPASPTSPPVFEDWRVLVSTGRVVAAMARRSAVWITNVHQGGRPAAHTPEPEMARLALAAAAAVGVAYGGVDLIRGRDGDLLVLEVNSNPAWRGLQSVADVDIAAALADDLLASLTPHATVLRKVL